MGSRRRKRPRGVTGRAQLHRAACRALQRSTQDRSEALRCPAAMRRGRSSAQVGTHIKAAIAVSMCNKQLRAAQLVCANSDACKCQGRPGLSGMRLSLVGRSQACGAWCWKAPTALRRRALQAATTPHNKRRLRPRHGRHTVRRPQRSNHGGNDLAAAAASTADERATPRSRDGSCRSGSVLSAIAERRPSVLPARSPLSPMSRILPSQAAAAPRRAACLRSLARTASMTGPRVMTRTVMTSWRTPKLLHRCAQGTATRKRGVVLTMRLINSTRCAQV